MISAFDDNACAHLSGKLRDLPRYNGLLLPQDYFEQAMERLKGASSSSPAMGTLTRRHASILPLPLVHGGAKRQE